MSLVELLNKATALCEHRTDAGVLALGDVGACPKCSLVLGEYASVLRGDAQALWEIFCFSAEMRPHWFVNVASAIKAEMYRLWPFAKLNVHRTVAFDVEESQVRWALLQFMAAACGVKLSADLASIRLPGALEVVDADLLEDAVNQTIFLGRMTVALLRDVAAMDYVAYSHVVMVRPVASFCGREIVFLFPVDRETMALSHDVVSVVESNTYSLIVDDIDACKQRLCNDYEVVTTDDIEFESWMGVEVLAQSFRALEDAPSDRPRLFLCEMQFGASSLDLRAIDPTSDTFIEAVQQFVSGLVVGADDDSGGCYKDLLQPDYVHESFQSPILLPRYLSYMLTLPVQAFRTSVWVSFGVHRWHISLKEGCGELMDAYSAFLLLLSVFKRKGFLRV